MQNVVGSKLTGVEIFASVNCTLNVPCCSFSGITTTPPWKSVKLIFTSATVGSQIKNV